MNPMDIRRMNELTALAITGKATMDDLWKLRQLDRKLKMETIGAVVEREWSQHNANV